MQPSGIASSAALAAPPLLQRQRTPSRPEDESISDLNIYSSASLIISVLLHELKKSRATFRIRHLRHRPSLTGGMSSV